MVRKLILYFSLISLFGCTKQDYILVQNNDLLRYENYPDNSKLTFSFAGTFLFNGGTFDAQKQTQKILISGNDSIITCKVINRFTYSYYEYDKDNIEPDFSEKKNIHLCGVLDLIDGITSYVVSIDTHVKNIDDVSGASFIELYLINFNANKLTSIILLSLYSPDLAESSAINTYMMDELCFSQIDYANSSTNVSIESYIPHSVMHKYFNVKNNTKILYFSLFTINEDGFIAKINL
jgi:hypothetical protein